MREFRLFVFCLFLSTAPFLSSAGCQYDEQGKGYLYSRHASFMAPYIGGLAIAAAVIVAIVAATHGQEKCFHSHHASK